MNKTYSYGTLGDHLVSYINLLEYVKFNNLSEIDHFFVSDKRESLNLMKQFINLNLLDLSDFEGVKFNFEFRFIYGYLILEEFGLFCCRKFIPYIFNIEKKHSLKLKTICDNNNKYSVVVQQDPSTDPLRRWQFDPENLVKKLNEKGVLSCLVGWDNNLASGYKNNLIGKLSFVEIINTILNCDIFISNLGFHSLLKLSSGGKVIYNCKNVDPEDYVLSRQNGILVEDATIESLLELVSSNGRKEINYFKTGI